MGKNWLRGKEFEELVARVVHELQSSRAPRSTAIAVISRE